jgi:RNA polymerase sigma-70 factor (ECF subfamily)
VKSLTGQEETDESLMRRFQAGDGEAFDVLFDRYSARLINFAHRFLRSKEESEDAAQEVLLRVHGAKDRYDPSRPFRPWLFSIAARLASNRLRHRKRHPFLSIFFRDEVDVDSPLSVDPPDRPLDRPEQTAETTRLAEAVRSSLDKLPESQRTAVVLARFEEMSYEDIAQVMHLSVPSVKSLLFRARQTLKNELRTHL